MKPCSIHRKSVALLAAGALDSQEERSLRAHLATCECCRGYYEEVSRATQKLHAIEPRSDIQTSEGFHNRVLGALGAEARIPAWQSALMRIRASLLNWRVAVPLAGATAIVLLALSLPLRRPAVSSPGPTGLQVASAPGTKADLEPTVSNYQTVANRSLEKLDDLLTRQGNHNPGSSPIYTASSLSQVNGLE
jgi:hypothetical protein